MAIDLKTYLDGIAELVSESSLMELVELIWANDRYYTSSKFQATSRAVSSKLRDWDVKVKHFDLPADGKTVYGDWKMPLGWECKSAKLEIYNPFEERGKVLADYAARPTSVIMWSGPTPAGGLTAPVVRVADADELEAKREEVKGKIVYTPVHPKPFKHKLVEYGAAAVVTSYCKNAHHLNNATFWFNAWSDDPGGWAFHADDTPLPGMAISPQWGVELDILLDRGPVQLRMNVDTSYEETKMPALCGYIDAELQEEVLAIGHAQEQGANDNASGCAVILESLRVLKQATEAGKLPKLRRGVRGLLVNECYGTIGFAVSNPGILRRMVAGVNWDTVGRHGEDTDAHYRHHTCPDAAPSVADTLMALMLENWLPTRLPYMRMDVERPFALTDNVFADPALGVPTTFVLSTDRYWHTSRDTPDTLSPRTLHAFGTLSVAYMHFLATAGYDEAHWLAGQALKRYGRRVENLGADYALQLDDCENDAAKAHLLARAADHLAYLREISDQTAMSAKKFMPRDRRAEGHKAMLKLNRHMRRLCDLQNRRLKELAGVDPAPEAPVPNVAELGDLAGKRPKRTFLGTPTYDSVPREHRNKVGSPVWNAAVHGALFWADGKRTLAEITRRTNYEHGGDFAKKLAQQFGFMAEHGLIEWVEGDGK